MLDNNMEVYVQVCTVTSIQRNRSDCGVSAVFMSCCKTSKATHVLKQFRIISRFNETKENCMIRIPGAV